MRAACVDFGGTTIKMGRFADGVLRASETVANTDRPDDLDAVARLLRGWQDEYGPAEGVGIAVPGVVSADGSNLRSAHGKYAHLAGRDLRAWSADVLGAGRVVVENDARACLAGELADGVARGHRDAVLVILGTGIGTAASVEGRLVRGAHGFGAILGGHTTLELSGPTCPCGNVGCAEALAGGWALREAASRLPGFVASPLSGSPRPGFADVLDAAAAGDPCAVALWERLLEAWAALVVTLCHTFDPSVVVLAGGPVRAAAQFLPRLSALVDAHLWGGLPRPALVASRHPGESVLHGLDRLVHHQERR